MITAVSALLAGCNPYVLTNSLGRGGPAASPSGTASPGTPTTDDGSEPTGAAGAETPSPTTPPVDPPPPDAATTVTPTPAPESPDTPTPTPSATPEPTPDPAPTPAPGPAPLPTATPDPTEVPSPTQSPSPATPSPATPSPATPSPATPPPAPTAEPAPAGTPGAGSAAEEFGWGRPDRSDDFTTAVGPDWGLYDGDGHNGQGRRSPDAVSVADGIMTINGSADGTTDGMAWGSGQKYGRWEVRVRAPRSDPSYHAVALLWPDAENWPVGGEVDFMEMMDPSRQTTNFFLHYGKNNNQVSGDVDIDATQWHDWAVEWTPDHIIGYVDGREWFRTTDTSILPPGPMHLTLQLDWFPDGGQVTPSSMQVDWAASTPTAEPAAQRVVPFGPILNQLRMLSEASRSTDRSLRPTTQILAQSS